MKRPNKTPLSAQKRPKRTNTRRLRSIVAYLQSDAYLFAPLFSKFSPLPPQMLMPPPASFISSKASDVKVEKNKKRLSEKVKEYLNSDYHMYRPMISLPKPGSSLKDGELRITNLVILDGQRTGLSRRETVLSPAFCSLPVEKMVKPDPRRIPIE